MAFLLAVILALKFERPPKTIKFFCQQKKYLHALFLGYSLANHDIFNRFINVNTKAHKKSKYCLKNNL